MEIINIKVEVDRSQLTSLKSDVQQLQNAKIKIQNLGNVNAELDTTARTLGRITNLTKEQITIAPDDTAIRAVRTYNTGLGQTLQVTDALNRETEEWDRVVSVATNDVVKAEQQRIKSANQSLQATKLLNDMMQQEAVAANSVVTPMQKQINAMVGIGTATNSARESARAFIMHGLTDTEIALNKAELAATNTRKAHQLLGDSLTNIAAKMAVWQIMGTVVATPIRSLREALRTMKDVDDELVTVRKVTGLAGEELERLEEQAYKTASAYGEGADEYLGAVSEFARAGYREQSEALAELSTKTQIVGDTTAETANQFLLSIDAAYKYEGQIDKLTRVLDGANEIDNKYATSIKKIAEGLGKVAPVAAQAHIGVNELTAAIGTITAATQRSGTEAATALRALYLNILGDTKTEIDEGVTWTTGEIAGLRDVINTYAADVVKAADATGSVINPMEAIGALAKAMEDGLLTEQKLMEMVSDIGGKLRTSQLLALIQNWDMYNSMLEDTANSAGSADREVANALDSWTRKSEILKNTWTEFVSDILDTDIIKGGLDVLIDGIELLDSDFGKAMLTVVAINGAIGLTGKGFGIAGEAIKLAAVKANIGTVSFLGLSAAEQKAAADAFTLGGAFNVLTTAMLKNPLFWAAAGITAIFAIGKVIDAVTVDLEEQREAVQKLNAEYEKQFGAGSEYDTLLKKEGELTAAEEQRLKVLKGQNEALKEQIRIAQDEEWKKFRDSQDAPISAAVGTTNAQYTFEQFQGRVHDNLFAMTGGNISQDDYSAERSQIISDYKDYYDTLIEYRELGKDLDGFERMFIIHYEQLAKEIAEVAEKTDDLAEATGNGAKAAADALALYEKMQGAYEALDKAEAEMIENQKLSYDTVKALKDAGLSEYLVESADGYKLAEDALEDYIAAQRTEYDIALNEAQTAAEKLYDANRLEAAGYDLATMSIKQKLKAMQELYYSEFYAEMIRLNGMGAGVVDEIDLSWRLSNEYAAYNQIEQALKNLDLAQGNYDAFSGALSTLRGDYSTATKAAQDASKKAIDEALKQAKKIRDQQLEALDDELDALKKERDVRKDELELEEKILAVQKAQAALANAQAERTVRYFNAATGQWEWGADKKNVEKAKEDFDKAQKELEDYRDELAYEAAVALIEEKKAAINDAYELIEDALDDGQLSAEELDGILEYLNNSTMPELSTMFSKLLSTLQAFITGIKQIKIPSVAGGGGGGGGSSSTLPWYDDDDTNDNGSGWYDDPSMAGSRSESAAGALADANNADPSMRGSVSEQAAHDLWVEEHTKGYNGTIDYDSGGVLYGMGGIKATMGNEMVVPPDITSRMLTPVADSVFQQRMQELRFLYGERAEAPASLGGVAARSSIDNSGDEYHFGDVIMTEQQARGTTVYELAQMSRNLGIYGAN